MKKIKNRGIDQQVYQYNALTGALISYYRDIEKAALHSKTKPEIIKQACEGEVKEVNGSFFNYNLYQNFMLNRDKRKKKVFQFSNGGEFLKSFDSVAEAALKTNVNKTSIAKCCRGEYNSAGSYNWEYQSETGRGNEGDSI